MLKKITVIVLAALGLAATAHADKGGPGPMGGEDCPAHAGWHRPNPERMARFFEKRLAMLHDELKLSGEQEPAWKAFTDKLKPQARPERPDFKALAGLPTPERLDRLMAFSKARQERQMAHVAAVKEFYGQLTAEQKKTFDARFLRFTPGGQWEGHRPHREGR